MTVDRIRESLVLQSPAPHSTGPKPRLRMPVPVALPVLPQVRLPIQEIAPVAMPPGDALWDYLESQQQDLATQLKPKVMGSELAKALQAPAALSVLREGQGFRSVDGERVVKMGDSCGEIHTVQASSSPTNRVDIAMPLDCPGTYAPSMGDRLLAWAEKVSLPP